jgi:hypothetical protein
MTAFSVHLHNFTELEGAFLLPLAHIFARSVAVPEDCERIDNEALKRAVAVLSNEGEPVCTDFYQLGFLKFGLNSSLPL